MSDFCHFQVFAEDNSLVAQVKRALCGIRKSWWTAYYMRQYPDLASWNELTDDQLRAVLDWIEAVNSNPLLTGDE